MALVLQNKEVLLDDDILSLIKDREVYVNSKGYVRAYINGNNIMLHRWILDAPRGLEVDHIDGNKMNNLRSNLRLATHQQNQWNTKKPSGKNRLMGAFASGAASKKNPWYSQIRMNGKMKHLGMFKTEEEAANAYTMAAQELHGEFYKANRKVA